MILSDFKQVLNTPDKLMINSDFHYRTWESYFLQYKNAFLILLKNSLECKYRTNYIFMPFMFLFRQSMELYVKYISQINDRNSATLYKSHNMDDFKQNQSDKCKDVLEALSCLQKDTKGACWRYPMNRNGELYFEGENTIDSYNACMKYLHLFNIDDMQLGVSVPKEDTRNRRLYTELLFYPHECTTIGQVATQYDFALANLFQVINQEDITINEIYLPVLFMLRHTLELKLKHSIINLGNIVTENTLRKVRKEHSVSKLYTILASFIDAAILKISDIKFKEESEYLCNLTIKYKDMINMLDANSYIFRYPFDIRGNVTNFLPDKDIIRKTVDLYVQTDPFICFGPEILMYDGALEVGSDILDSMFN